MNLDSRMKSSLHRVCQERDERLDALRESYRNLNGMPPEGMPREWLLELAEFYHFIGDITLQKERLAPHLHYFVYYRSVTFNHCSCIYYASINRQAHSMRMAELNYYTALEGIQYLIDYPVPSHFDHEGQAYFKATRLPIERGILHELAGEICFFMRHPEAERHFELAAIHLGSVDFMDQAAETWYDSAHWFGAQEELCEAVYSGYGLEYRLTEDYPLRLQSKRDMYKKMNELRDAAADGK